MSVHSFGSLPDATEILEIRLRNDAGVYCSIITLGAAVRDLVVPIPAGNRHVVLGYPDLGGYLADTNYIGVTAGRYASRISRGRIRIDGREHLLTINDRGRNHLHGGMVGFSARPWRVLAADESSVMLALTSPDGDQGYPGTLEVRCLYRLLSPASLHIVMTATTDAPTIVNLAHHSYFSLMPSPSISDHSLQVNARLYVPFDEEMLPNGEIRSVGDTPGDFRALRKIERAGHTYDMAFVLDRSEDELNHAATLVAPDQALAMELHTSEPCLIFYDGGHIAPGAAGLDGAPYAPHAGLCLEPMRYPDSPNQPSFPAAVLRPGEIYRQVTEYRFRPPSTTTSG